MAVVHSPTLRGRRLALELRTLREAADLTVAEAARRVGWNNLKLSRVEKAETAITDDDLRALLQMYGVAPERHAALLQLNQESWQRGWWTAYGDVFTGNFVMLESQARAIETFQSMFIPGLFQTPEYATELFRRMQQSAGEADIARRVEARMARQSALRRSDPPQISAVIDEAALRRAVGGPRVMAGQVRELMRFAELSHVTVQVVPFTAGAHEGQDGPFTLFLHPDEPGLDVGYTEGQHGAVSLESAQELSRLRLVFRSVSKAALSPEETSEWLAGLTRE